MLKCKDCSKLIYAMFGHERMCREDMLESDMSRWFNDLDAEHECHRPDDYEEDR